MKKKKTEKRKKVGGEGQPMAGVGDDWCLLLWEIRLKKGKLRELPKNGVLLKKLRAPKKEEGREQTGFLPVTEGERG